MVIASKYYDKTSILPIPTITKCSISMTLSYICSLKVEVNTVVFMNAIKIYHLLYYNTLTVLLEYADCLLQLIFPSMHEYFYYISIDPIMLSLCLMFSVIHYAQNYDGALSRSLDTDVRTIFV